MCTNVPTSLIQLLVAHHAKPVDSKLLTPSFYEHAEYVLLLL